MATTTTYPDGSLPSSPKAVSPTNPRSNTKRKRDGSPSTPNRSAPSARRSTSQQFAAQNTAPAQSPEADYEDNSTSGFDLSALQANPPSQQPPPPSGTNMDTAAAALNYSMAVPDSAGSGFQLNSAGSAHDFSAHNGSAHPHTPGPIGDHSQSPPLEAPPSAPLTTGAGKPAVGSNEWHKVRKDNHKEVERRRRETINEGINELAKIVPGCEKNKGSILQRAVQYIQKLQDDAQANIDKWTFEKLVTEQAINDLSGKLERIQREKEVFKLAAEDAGADMEAAARKIGAGADDAKDAEEAS